MTKEKPKVIFQDKEMNLLEAKLYLVGLSLGIVNVSLMKDEENDYIRWKDIKNNRNEIARIKTGEILFKNINKKGYLIENLENKIESIEIAKKILYCNEHGHKEKKGNIPKNIGNINYVSCSRCGLSYEKNKPHNYDKSSNKNIYNPFNS